MPSLPTLKAREVLQVLLKAGFYVHHQKGSHARLFHRDKLELKVTIPIHNKDIPERTLSAILRQASITAEEFLELLKR